MASYARRRRWQSTGIMLAIMAGVTTIGFTGWPIAQPSGPGRVLWWAASIWIVGFAEITAALLAERHGVAAKAILTTGALWLAGSALVSAEILREPTLSWLSVVVGLIPAASALAAGVLIKPTAPSPGGRATRPGLGARETGVDAGRGARRAA